MIRFFLCLLSSQDCRVCWFVSDQNETMKFFFDPDFFFEQLLEGLKKLHSALFLPAVFRK